MSTSAPASGAPSTPTVLAGAGGDRSLGDGRLLGPKQLAPSRIDEGPWTIVATGVDHGCAVDGASALPPSCWGRGEEGQLGNGGVGVTPSAISGRWSDVSTSGGHTCAIAEVDGTLWCWGNTLRVEPNGTLLEELPGDRSPVRIGQDAWLDVDGSCAIRDDGTNTFRPEPTAVAVADPALDWSTVSVGTDHACALGADSSVWCWGFGAGGLSGSFGSVPTPTRFGTAPWSQISVGQGHRRGIQTDASLWCWGSNSQGQLGTGNLSNLADADGPVAIRPDLTWKQVDAGTWTSIAIQQN